MYLFLFRNNLYTDKLGYKILKMIFYFSIICRLFFLSKSMCIALSTNSSPQRSVTVNGQVLRWQNICLGQGRKHASRFRRQVGAAHCLTSPRGITCRVCITYSACFLFVLVHKLSAWTKPIVTRHISCTSYETEKA